MPNTSFHAAGLELRRLSLIFYWGWGKKKWWAVLVFLGVGRRAMIRKLSLMAPHPSLCHCRIYGLKIKPTSIWFYIPQMKWLSQISQLFLQTSESLYLKLFKQGMLSLRIFSEIFIPLSTITRSLHSLQGMITTVDPQTLLTTLKKILQTLFFRKFFLHTEHWRPHHFGTHH